MMIPGPHLSIAQVRDSLYPYFLHRALGQNRRFPSHPGLVPSDAELRAKAENTFQSFFKFASVRNPWARAVSLYQRQEGLMAAEKMDFETFCSRLGHASDTCVYPTRTRNQLDWMTSPDGTLAVDFVLRLEEQAEGLAEIKRRTEGRVDLEALHLNRNPTSGSARYRDLYTPRAQEAIAETFAKDIEFFGYEF